MFIFTLEMHLIQTLQLGEGVYKLLFLIISLTLSIIKYSEYLENTELLATNLTEFQHHGQRTACAMNSLCCLWSWMQWQHCSRITEPVPCSCWRVHKAITCTSPGQTIHIFIHVSVYTGYFLLWRRDKKQAIIVILCNIIHGIVKEAWEENRKCCQRITVLHMGEKIWKPFKSSAVTVLLNSGTYSLTYTIISHAQSQCQERVV